MKKIMMNIMVVAIIFTLSSFVFASEMGEIVEITDIVKPDGENAIITQTIDAITSAEGTVIFPVYKDSEIIAVSADLGTLESDPELITYGDMKYYAINFEEHDAEVKFTVSLSKAGVYIYDEADLGDTFPSDALVFAYKIVNSSPIEIGKYTAKVAVPKNKELMNIVDFNAKKPYAIEEFDGYVFGTYNFKSLDSGEEAELEINVYEPSKGTITLIWSVCILISILYLLKSRYLLAEAKKIKAEKKD